MSARPAKKIISYLGFPGTSGYSFYDYIITDNIVTPESHQKYYTEKFLYLPRYQVNDGRGMIETNSIKKSDVNLPEKSIVLSCFNQSFKLDSMMFSCWIKILNHIPNSCLWLLEDNEFAKKNIIDYSESNGLDKNKIIFAPRISRDMHMERLKLSDISLDTRIYNGHTTTTDSLQSSIPVVTLEGNHFASRVSASLIKSYGLDDLIVQSLDEYHQKVIKLCLDRDYMSSIRKKIKDKKNINRFFNVKEFTKHLEDQLIDIIKN